MWKEDFGEVRREEKFLGQKIKQEKSLTGKRNNKKKVKKVSEVEEN